MTTILSTNDALALRRESAAAAIVFRQDVETGFSAYANRAAGLMEVYGGSYHGLQDAEQGITIAVAAIAVLKGLQQRNHFLFSLHGTIYHDYWDASLGGNE